jgi:hypothetical protein
MDQLKPDVSAFHVIHGVVVSDVVDERALAWSPV